MATFDIERFPNSATAKRMLSYVTPGWYERSYVGKWLYEVMGRELDDADEYVEDLLNQLFPETATWGLKYHEIKYGLDIIGSLSTEERQKRIIEKRDKKISRSPWSMERFLENIVDCNVSVRDIMDGAPVSHPNIFQVRFYGEDGLDMTAALKGLNDIKQSHTVYEIYNLIAVMELEEFIYLPTVRVRITAKWNDYTTTLDGEYNLDGSILLNNPEHPLWNYIKIHFAVEHSEDVQMACYVPDNSIFLNGHKKLDGRYYMNGGTIKEDL